MWFAATLAHSAYQTLRHDTFQGSCDEVAVDADIDQPYRRGYSIIGVERGQYQMPRHCSPKGYFRGFTIADFANEQNIWVLAQGCPQNSRKIQAYFFFYLPPLDTRKAIFHGIFYSHDFSLSLVDF